MGQLSITQRRWWIRLEELVKERNVNDQYGLQAAIRQLALEIIKEQQPEDQITVDGQTLRRFGSKHEFHSKEAFINYHSKNGRWGDDSLLYPLLDALGYTVFIHNKAPYSIPPYKAYEQHSQSGLKIDIVNYTTISENYAGYVEGCHYALKGERTPADGNCMYHTVAQQVQKDMSFIAEQLNLPTLASYAININAPKISLLNRIARQDHPSLTKEERIYFEERDKIEAAKEKEVNTLLTDYSTAQLIAVYHALKNPADGDTYLLKRPEHSAAEQHGNAFMQKALDSNQWDEDIEFLLREELIHALAKEAWRNPQAYEAIIQQSSLQQSAQNLNQIGFLAAPKTTTTTTTTCAAEAVEEELVNLPTTATCTVY